MNNMLYKLVQEAKTDETALEKVIHLFEPKIRKLIYNTGVNNREDLTQELKLKLLSDIRRYDVESIPGFWTLKENLKSE